MNSDQCERPGNSFSAPTWLEQRLRDRLVAGHTTFGAEEVQRVVTEVDQLRALVRAVGVPLEDADALRRALSMPESATFIEVVKRAVHFVEDNA